MHIHASRFCNLRCEHCYSWSSPDAVDGMRSADLLTATAALAEAGYQSASLSGGEPTLLPGIGDLCSGLKHQGYRVSMISNGLLADRLEALVCTGLVDQVAISFDGLSGLHDRIRGRRGAFDRALASARRLRSLDVKTGAIVAVTARSLPELPELVALLCGVGIGSIQFHPICQVGRATESKNNHLDELDAEALVRLLALTQIFGRLWDGLRFTCDATVSRALDGITEGLSQKLVSPLVINESGDFIPLAYGVNPALAMGNIRVGAKDVRYSDALIGLIERTVARCRQRVATPFYGELVRESRRLASPEDEKMADTGSASGASGLRSSQ